MQWLRRLSERYENSIFNFESVTYKSYLEEKWGIDIPDSYSSRELEELELLETDIHPRKTDTFEDIILSYFYDTVFSFNTFSKSLIVPLIKNYDKARWEENNKFILLRKIYHNRIDEWKQKLSDDNLLNILEEVLTDSEKVKIELMKYKILRSDFYRDIGRVELGEKYNVFNQLKLNLRHIEIDTSKIKDTIKKIEIRLNTLSLPKSAKELEELINSLSGLISIEYFYIENLLSNNPTLVNNSTISIIKSVFTPIYAKIGKRIEKLKTLIMPARPSKISTEEDIETVKEWLRNKYLPFYEWLNKNNKHDEDLIEVGDTFSEWYYENWEHIKANSNSLVSNWFYKNSKSFNEKDKISLIIIVDNLSWNFYKLVEERFLENEFNLSSKEPYFAMIPSETETSKKCLLSGKSDYREIDQRSYEDILAKGWIPYFNSPEFIYLPHLDAFEDTELEKGKSYFINYRPIDDALHKSPAELGLSHEKHINNLITDLSNRVNERLEMEDLKSNTVIHIISDHGSTKFHKHSTNDIDISLFKNKDSKKLSERFMILTDKEYDKLQDNLKFDCFFIDKNRFGLPNHCLCARRANTFKKYHGDNYVHGGLLPEEVVVPHMRLEKMEMKFETPLIDLIKNKFRYKAEEIEFEVFNPNTYPIENIRVEINNDNVVSNPAILEWIAAKSKDILIIPARFKKTSNEEEIKKLNLTVKYLINNKPYDFAVSLDITMVSMVELKDTSVFDI